MPSPPSPDDLSPVALAMDWAARIMAVSLEMVLPGLAGVWLDRRWGTQFMALVGFAFGLFAGMVHLMAMVSRTGGKSKSGRSRGGQRDVE